MNETKSKFHVTSVPDMGVLALDVCDRSGHWHSRTVEFHEAYRLETWLFNLQQMQLIDNGTRLAAEATIDQRVAAWRKHVSAMRVGRVGVDQVNLCVAVDKSSEVQCEDDLQDAVQSAEVDDRRLAAMDRRLILVALVLVWVFVLVAALVW